MSEKTGEIKEKFDVKLQVKSFFQAKKSLEKLPFHKPPVQKPLKSKTPQETQSIDLKILEKTQKFSIFPLKTRKNHEKRKKTPQKPPKSLENVDFPRNSLINNEEKSLMEEILLYEAKIEENVKKITIKTFLVIFWKFHEKCGFLVGKNDHKALWWGF